MSFQEFYKTKVVPELMQELGIKNPMRVPKLDKIVVSSCVKDALQDSKALTRAAEEIALITGQKPLITKAKKSIATFKLRQGVPIGCKVTLRQKKMYEFFNRLVNVALPRTRDFKGVSDKGFDGRGNYNLGITEQILFSEIPYDKIDKIRGMNVTIVTTARTDDEGRILLKKMGIPFRGGVA
ncbi:MAG: 50S ribosomal protein L5 [bacterium]|nr:50S ribosomal protein L5 [bacterium]